jgi:hypothetical protein
LKLFAKDLETNLKSENRKGEKEIKKRIKGPRGTHLARLQNRPMAHFPANPNRYSLSLPSPADGGAHLPD